MTIFFSASAMGFFDDTVHSFLPPDAVEISPATHAALLAGQAAGQVIAAGAGGVPGLVTPAAPSGAEVLTAWRAGAEVSAFQAKAALYNRGLLDDAEAVAVAAGGLTLLAWQTAVSFQRLSPTITALAPAIGITTPEDLDELFVEAAAITA